jgi:ribulose-phosphate 3-epimerase
MCADSRNIEIVPAILTHDPEELVRFVHIFERAGVKRVHLDICDGVFVPVHTIMGHEEIRRLHTPIEFDVHLMVADPDGVCEPWRGTRARRLIVHMETVKDFAALAGHAHDCGKELGAAINPETPLATLDAVNGIADFVQFMTVHPGAQGRVFLPEVPERIRLYHANHPHMTVMVDGGITPDTAPVCAAAGASVLVAGSFVVRSHDPAAALNALWTSIS